MICLTLKLNHIYFVYPIEIKEKILQEKSFLRKRGSGGLKKKRKSFSNVLAKEIKKDPTTSIRKHTKDLKVHKKTVKTATKQDLCPNLNPLDYALLGVLENETKSISHPNIGSLKTAIEEEWNRMFEEFILKACKLFRSYVDTIIEKRGGHNE